MKLKLFILLNFLAVSLSSFALTENEKNSIEIFENTVKSVVYVSNIKLARTWWDMETVEIPAGAGSGFVWDEKGHIVTNGHVVDNGDSFLVSFHKDKKQYKAELVGVAPDKDIAVLKLVEKPSSLSPIQVGTSSDLKVGQKAVAIGNPFGLDHTMTEGIISALERKIKGFGGVTIEGMIQTDASINPGNSGGPLLNSDGRLIGINTMIYSNSGSSAGVGFAVPVDTVNKIVPQLIQFGKVIRPGLGITTHPSAQRYTEEGVVIVAILPRGSADKAGLEGMKKDVFGRYHLGDIILKVGDTKVNSRDDLYLAMEKYKIGDKVEITYRRGRNIKTTTVVLQKI